MKFVSDQWAVSKQTLVSLKFLVNQSLLFLLIHLAIPATSSKVVKPKATRATGAFTISGKGSILLIKRMMERTARRSNNEDSSLISEVISLLIAHKNPGKQSNASAMTSRFESFSSPLLITDIIRPFAIMIKAVQIIKELFLLTITTSKRRLI